MPAENVKAMLCDAGKAFRLGSTLKRAINMRGVNLDLDFSGEQDPDLRAKDKDCRDERIVALNPQTKTKGIRTRPIFEDWVLSGELAFNDKSTTAAEIKEIFESAGLSGFCERHAGFGQFDVTEWEKVD